MKDNKIGLCVLFLLGLSFSNASLAHTSGLFFTQLIHHLLHAHHAYAGLFFVVAIVAMFKIKSNRSKRNKVMLDRKRIDEQSRY